ncbi:MAG: protein TolQ [Nitrospinae bacterium]|nr:protein TolQ [Nitrospinota bacterium]
MDISEYNVIVMIMQAGIVAKCVLLLLLIMSIICWGIIIAKAVSYARVNNQGKNFRAEFEASSNLTQLYNDVVHYKETPLSAIYSAGYLEIQKSLGQQSVSGKGSGEKVLSEVGYRSLERVLDRTASEEVIRLERKINFLATTGNTAPFIGLFGTVWGVMDAFRVIGVKGSASISGVAPGISEALIATAAGLAAAIPAVIAYNTFVHKVKRYEKEIDAFILDFLILVEKNFKVEHNK